MMSSSLTGKNDCELCETPYPSKLLRNPHTAHGEKMFKCHHCSYKTVRQSNHTPVYRKRKNETKSQLSPE